jgi:hypothetical protein
MKNEITNFLKDFFEKSENKIILANEIKEIIHILSENHNPVDLVKWIPLDKIQANDYNPNSVA